MEREWKRQTEGELEEPADAPTERGGCESEIPVETIESLRAEIERLRAESERNWQQFLRTAADLENYRKQAARQREEAVAATRRALLDVILGVVDNLERALEHAEGVAAADGEGAAAAIVDGIRLAHRQVLDVLRSMGVRPMDTVGASFDPRMHDAAEAVSATGKAPGTIVGEVRRGYLLGDEVLRPARVRVAQ